uniref:Kelch like family member 34 n=1 Tax=Zonotrichia albicollis TaxID=44394 RepID=A0A8D2NIB5_ZONAL
MSLRSEGFLCDILLKVKENEFPAHKSLLACSSDYFRAMFKSYTQESKASVIHLQVVSPTGLQHILDFIYTSLLPLSFESLEDTLEAASYLQVTDAIGLCNQYLVKNLALENCCYSANVHIRYGLIPVEELRKTYTQSEVSLSAGIKCMIIKAINYHTSVYKQPVLQDKSTMLRNQKTRIILLGGGTASEGLVTDVVAFDTLLVTNKVHRYDPRFNTWTQITGMLEKRCQFSCCVLGKDIFAIGGRGEDGSLHSSVEVYDISRDRWTKARELPCRIHGHASAVCKDTIYISGGKYSAPASTSNDVYSLSSLEGQWVKRAPMSIARFGHQMATIRGSIFTFLGLYEPFSEIERYDPDQNQWTRLKPLIYDRFSYGLAVVEETALLIGGKKWQNSLEVSTQDVVGYDIDNDGWEEICKAPLPWCGLQCAVLQLSEVAEEQDSDSHQKKLPSC